MTTSSSNTLFLRHFPITCVDTPQTNALSPSLSRSSPAKRSGPSPPLLALGMLQWGTTPVDNSIINGSRGILTEAEAREIYQAFRSRGVVLFDTAEGYGGGTSEKRLGLLQEEERKEAYKIGKKKIIVGEDDSATVATYATEDAATDEVTFENNMSHTHKNIIIMTKFLPVPWRFTHAHFENALRASNKRLGIKTCPIYLLHSPMHLFRAVEYWVESAAICKKKGLLEAFGLSNCNSDEVRKAVKAGEKFGVPVVVNQVHYSLLDFNSRALQEMKRTCDELNVFIIAYNSLGQGLLTDNLTKQKFASNKPAKMMGIGWDDLTPLRTALREIADAHGCTADGNVARTMAQVALAWCRAKGTIPLVGCRSKDQAEDTLASLSLHLSPEEVAALDTLAMKKCTLDSPSWRRKVFVILAGLVMVTCRWLDRSHPTLA
ncbi:hypothetical protein ACHAXR_012767 [Thalassiosira sp. AJA248-18]